MIITTTPTLVQGAHAWRACRAIRASPWAGTWTSGAWNRGYLMGLEDPFDATDNVFRTLSLTNAKLIRDAMERSANSLTSLGNEAGEPGALRVWRGALCAGFSLEVVCVDGARWP